MTHEGSLAVEAVRGGKFNAVDATFVGQQDILEISQLFRTNEVVQTFSLRFSTFDHSSIREFTEALLVNTALTALSLTGTGIDDDGARDLAAVLRSNNSIKVLNLFDNEITVQGVKHFSEALFANPTSKLHTLSLEKNDIGDEGAGVLADVLRFSRTLTSLHIGANTITDQGAQSLVRALITNKTLLTLNLADNSISDFGAESFAELLKTSPLQLLDLSENDLVGSSIASLAAAMATNIELRSLNLAGNKIPRESAHLFVEPLEQNKLSVLIDLKGIYAFGPLKKLLLRNRKLAGISSDEVHLDDVVVTRKSCLLM